MATGERARCPRCDGALGRQLDQPDWCPSCEWNLIARNYRQVPRVSRGARRARDRAFAINQTLLTSLRDTTPRRPTTTGSRTIIATVALIMLLFDLVLVVGGAYFVVTATFFVKIIALIVLLIGIECRLRFPRMDTEHGEVTRTQAPHLFAVIDAARAAVKAPPIHIVVVDDDFNAFCGRTGLRRRAVLGIGLPLWGALSPDGRMALLGHELGHLVNGDPSTSFTTQPALYTFGKLAGLFHPRGLVARRSSAFDIVAIPLAYVIFSVPHLVFRWTHLALQRVALRDHQRAEIYADVLGSELGGNAGAQELARTLLFSREVRTAVQRAAISGSADPVVWRERAALALSTNEARTLTAEQLSLRMDASGYASHPPSGLRLRLISSWPDHAGHAVPARDMAGADAELTPAYRQAGRTLATQPAP